MCGIAGILSLSNAPVPPSELFNMLVAIRHRGPDDEGALLLESASGIYELRGGPDTQAELNLPDLRLPPKINVNIALGNRRLSIIDLSIKGHQPQTNEDQKVWVVFNGEVYNYRELKATLTASGHKFAGDSDTEVIIHGYEEWGLEGLLSRMVGMWGFALWDQNRKKLFLARDRFGIKPLYYHLDAGKLLFASEIKSIRTLFSGRINEHRVAELLWFKNFTADETFFDGINQVMASHYVEFDLSAKSFTAKRYWGLSKINESYDSLDLQEASKTFFQHFEQSIRLHMRSDVPIGTCLSGGLDSSSIVCLTQKLLKGGSLDEKGLKGTSSMSAFSSNPLEDDLSEMSYIETVVKDTGVTENVVSPVYEEFIEDLDRLVSCHDEPFTGPSVYMQYRVMKMVKEKGVKVLLDGQGGDELLAGYTRYFPYLFRDLRRNGQYFTFLREFIDSLDLTYPLLMRGLRIKMGVKEGSSTDLIKIAQPSSRALEYPTANLSELLRYELLAGSIIELLKYEDINSMAFSIESRVPFLYHPLIDYVFSLPVSAKIKNGWTKRVLRESMRGVIPEKVRLRRSKLGFPAPELSWARRLIAERRVWCQETVKNAEKYIDLNGFNALCERILSNNRYKDTDLFWRILLFSKWLEMHNDLVAG